MRDSYYSYFTTPLHHNDHNIGVVRDNIRCFTSSTNPGLVAEVASYYNAKMAEVSGGGKRLLPSGYEYEFISTVLDDYHCLICHLPLREPVQTRCGHRFCKNCLDEAIRRYEFNCHQIMSDSLEFCKRDP